MKLLRFSIDDHKLPPTPVDHKHGQLCVFITNKNYIIKRLYIGSITTTTTTTTMNNKTAQKNIPL